MVYDIIYEVFILTWMALSRLLLDCWSQALPQLVQPRFSVESFQKEALSLFGPLQRGVPLEQLVSELRGVMAVDGAPCGDPLGIPRQLWSRLRLARLFRMSCDMDTVHLEPELIRFSYREHFERPKTSVGVLVSNCYNAQGLDALLGASSFFRWSSTLGSRHKSFLKSFLIFSYLFLSFSLSSSPRL